MSEEQKQPSVLLVDDEEDFRAALFRRLNKRGLARANLTDQQQSALFDAFKFIWRSNKPIMEQVKELAARDGLVVPVKEVIDSMTNSSSQRFGRYLELFRD